MSTAASVRVCDWFRSFLHFRLDTRITTPRTVSHKPPFVLNHVRVPLESRAVVVERATGRRFEFLLTANCKTERVHVPRDIWTQPNADVIFVSSGDRFLIIKNFDHCGRQVMLHPPSLGEQPRRQVIDTSEAFTELEAKMIWNEGAVLGTTAEIIAAIQAGTPLTSLTTVENDRYTATLEYPVKTVNCSEVDNYYQTDTGPILLPDLALDPDELLGGVRLAFVAHSEPDWAEFILRAPTPTVDGVIVEHYSEALRIEGIRNQMVATGPAA